MLTVRSTINIASQTVPPIIPVVQGDTGRAILFTLADFTIPAGASATYYVQKPSGEAVYNNATIDGNNVLVELTAQSIIEKGDNYGQVRIAVGEDVVTSFDFILLVKEFRGIDATQSLTEMNIFDKAVEQAAAGDVSNKTVTFSTPSSPSSLASGDSLATLVGKLQAYINSRSYVGMIIHSTTLNTMAKVIAQYGGTTWIKHSGYFLYGASSNVVASSATATGGEATHTLTVDEMPSHNHGEASLNGEFTSYAWSTGYASGIMSNNGSNVNGQLTFGSDFGQASYGINASHTHSANGGGQAHNNMPPYKNVYIWERTA